MIEENELLKELPVSIGNSILKPKWDEAGRVYDWRNYVPIGLQNIWDKLSVESRIIIFYLTDTMAHQEDWD